MLSNVAICYATSHCPMSCCALLYRAVLCCAVLCCAVLCCAELCFDVLDLCWINMALELARIEWLPLLLLEFGHLN